MKLWDVITWHQKSWKALTPFNANQLDVKKSKRIPERYLLRKVSVCSHSESETDTACCKESEDSDDEILVEFGCEENDDGDDGDEIDPEDREVEQLMVIQSH